MAATFPLLAHCHKLRHSPVRYWDLPQIYLMTLRLFFLKLNTFQFLTVLNRVIEITFFYFWNAPSFLFPMKEPVIEYLLKAKSVKKILLCPGQYVLGTFLNKALWFLLLLNQLLSQAAGGIYLSLRPAFPWNIREKNCPKPLHAKGCGHSFPYILLKIPFLISLDIINKANRSVPTAESIHISLLNFLCLIWTSFSFFFFFSYPINCWMEQSPVLFCTSDKSWSLILHSCTSY